jgi:hypothetical protein
MKTLQQRFESKVERITESGCWLWTGSTTYFGYGQIRSNNRLSVAHRVAYELYVGQIPDGLCVLHRCDVPACANPGHLFVGSKKDNTQDMIKKGRDARLLAYANRKKTHCMRGHLFDEENTYWMKGGHRQCLLCKSTSDQLRYLRSKTTKGGA